MDFPSGFLLNYILRANGDETAGAIIDQCVPVYEILMRWEKTKKKYMRRFHKITYSGQRERDWSGAVGKRLQPLPGVLPLLTTSGRVFFKKNKKKN